jgi:hypothetical protein
LLSQTLAHICAAEIFEAWSGGVFLVGACLGGWQSLLLFTGFWQFINTIWTIGLSVAPQSGSNTNLNCKVMSSILNSILRINKLTASWAASSINLGQNLFLAVALDILVADDLGAFRVARGLAAAFLALRLDPCCVDLEMKRSISY